MSILISLLTGTACSDFSLCTNYSSQGCNKVFDEKQEKRGYLGSLFEGKSSDDGTK